MKLGELFYHFGTARWIASWRAAGPGSNTQKTVRAAALVTPWGTDNPVTFGHRRYWKRRRNELARELHRRFRLSPSAMAGTYLDLVMEGVKSQPSALEVACT